MEHISEQHTQVWDLTVQLHMDEDEEETFWSVHSKKKHNELKPSAKEEPR